MLFYVHNVWIALHNRRSGFSLSKIIICFIENIKSQNRITYLSIYLCVCVCVHVRVRVRVCVCVCVCGFPYLRELVMKKGVRCVKCWGVDHPRGFWFFRIGSRCDARYVKSSNTLSKINQNHTLHVYFAHAIIILVFLKQSKNFHLKILFLFSQQKRVILLRKLWKGPK